MRFDPTSEVGNTFARLCSIAMGFSFAIGLITLSSRGCFGQNANSNTKATPSLPANGTTPPPRSSTRSILELSQWEFRKENGTDWIPITTNDSWEKALGYRFDGKGTYRVRLPPLPGPASSPNATDTPTILLQCDAIATHARVSVDSKKVGEHLGGWTPFRLNLTPHYRENALLEIDVDERVGHNTQGFLPILLPHFGGIWQPARLVITPSSMSIDDLTLFAGGWTNDQIQVHATVLNYDAKVHSDHSKQLETIVELFSPEETSHEKTPAQSLVVASSGWKPMANPASTLPKEVDDSSSAFASTTRSFIEEDLQPSKVVRWSPEQPYRYLIRIALRDQNSQKMLDEVWSHAAIRKVEAKGRQILLNGEPIVLRGVLNWGYAPPRIAPSLDPEWMRAEIAFAKEYGFNLMKFCLWIPPKDYLRMCDEAGLLTWVEYPTWHPKLTQEFLPQLRKEYDEFFAYDRNHPSVVLRSLTCETGHSAELPVVRELYDRAHAAIPGSLIEDDSSWIGWHRVHDFYDDHPYGNNQPWKSTLQKLEDHIAARDPKPLVLGEAIAADTWTRPETFQDRNQFQEDPHRLRSAPETMATRSKLVQLVGEENVNRAVESSFSNALAMRKFQIERYRHQMLDQGYTVSVIRDFPLAAMGLIDFNGKPKWSKEEWSWHGERMICMETSNDRRSFLANELQRTAFHLVGSNVRQGSLQWRAVTDQSLSSDIKLEATQSDRMTTWDTQWKLTSNTPMHSPIRCTIEAEWNAKNAGPDAATISNRWPIWLFPKTESQSLPKIGYRHSSANGIVLDQTLEDYFAKEWSPDAAPNTGVVLAKALDLPLMDWMKRGGCVLVLANNASGSFPTQEHWFLRGGVVVNREAIGDTSLAQCIEELQVFDLESPIMANPNYLEEVTPWVLLWDNHDTKDYRIHAACWGAQFGHGKLWVSTLPVAPERGAAGSAVLAQAIRWCDSSEPIRQLSEATIERMSRDLQSRQSELAKSGWAFHVDKENKGLEKGWHLPDNAIDQWHDIAIGKHWDSQGYGSVDGWAWYAKRLPIPSDAAYMIFTGVDDYFELYVNGENCGSGGDREKKITAFEQTIALPIPKNARGRTAYVAVRVEDWQGAGGVFRPVFLDSQKPSPLKSILKRVSIDASP